MYKNTDFYLSNKNAFSVNIGENIGIVGPSGAGKSTLIKLLLKERTLSIDNSINNKSFGSIMFDKGYQKINLNDLTHEAFSDLFAYVSQANNLFMSLSIKDNLTYNCKCDFTKVIDLCKSIEVSVLIDKDGNNIGSKSFHDIIMNMKELDSNGNVILSGYDISIGSSACRLSGGQQQLLCVIRALISEKPILVLDEATSALDNMTQYNVKKIIDKIKTERLVVGKSLTIFQIAHRLSTIKFCDRIIVVNNNSIEAIGTYDDLLSDKNEINDEGYKTSNSLTFKNLVLYENKIINEIQ